ncbi:MAG: A/G-specific adenine glycosylase [Deltaproteobacteria bacterium]|nr:A/G-specific adenine glycosylase [Deltaproteobacteria bacterium]
MGTRRTSGRSVGRNLLRWYRRTRKPLPWRDDPAPYRVWVGEVMSQQTTLGVVVPRFERFVQELPDVRALAGCREARLGRLWAGLGYYARARNLRKGAQLVVRERSGLLPETYEGWLAIPGCGPYTAAMIASVCFGAREAAVDGNVVRVASRLLSLEEGVWDGGGRRRIERFAGELMERTSSPGDLNQAVMELGQEICAKKGPTCGACPVRTSCLALARGVVDRCPPPRPRRRPVDRAVTVVVVRHPASGRVLVGTRREGFLASTVGFALIDTKAEKKMLERIASLAAVEPERPGRPFKHTITHHRIAARVLVLDIGGRAPARARLAEALGLDSADWVPWAHARSAVASALDGKALGQIRARRPG